MPSRIDSPEYWLHEFKPSDAEMEVLYDHALDAMRPLEIEELATMLVRQRVDRFVQSRRVKGSSRAAVYRPTDRYERGQRLVFPALDGAEAAVAGIRPGNNPSYGAYEVIAVEIEGARREFAAGIAFDHHLTQADVQIDPDAVVATFAPLVAPRLASRLASDREWLASGHRWVLRELLPDVNAGHRNIAEAVVMLAGEPLPASQIVVELDLDDSIPLETRALALDIALVSDTRFRNVGAHEAPLWTLRAAV